MNDTVKSDSQENQELKTFGVVNVNEIHKTVEDRESESENKIVLKKWMTISLYVFIVLIALGFWKKYFFYLVPLPPIIAFFSFKIKTIAERLEKKNPV